MEIAIQAVKENRPDLDDDDIRLYFGLYNFSWANYEKNPETYRISYPWTISTIKQNPELLQLHLVYFHPNGTRYNINPMNGSYSKGCDDCYDSEIREDRLLWRVDIVPQPVDVDAETGEIVWPNFDPRPSPNIQIYDNITNARTVKELLDAKLNPPEITQIDIIRGAAEQTNSYSYYRPENARGVLEISSRVVWTNLDVSAHTVTSDTGYSNPYTGQFSSGHIMSNGVYEYAFIDVGEYPYHCEIHPWMRGEVEVVPNFA